jgi:hypothetical protein
MFISIPITRGTTIETRSLGRKEDARRSKGNMPTINSRDRKYKAFSPAAIQPADSTARVKRQNGRLRVENDARAAFFLFAWIWRAAKTMQRRHAKPATITFSSPISDNLSGAKL